MAKLLGFEAKTPHVVSGSCYGENSEHNGDAENYHRVDVIIPRGCSQYNTD